MSLAFIIIMAAAGVGAVASFVYWILENTTAGTHNIYSIAFGVGGAVYAGGGAGVSASEVPTVFCASSSSGVLWQKGVTTAYAANTRFVWSDGSGNVYFVFAADPAGGNGENLVKLNSSGVYQAKNSLLFPSSPGFYGTAGGFTTSAGVIHLASVSSAFTTAYITVDNSLTVSSRYTINAGYVSVLNKGKGRVFVDSSGNVYFLIGSINSTGITDPQVIMKISSAGVFQWSRSLNCDGLYGLTVSSAGDVYVTGQATVSTVPGILTAKYNSSGTLQWQRFLASSASGTTARGLSIAISSSNFVYVTGAISAPTVGQVIPVLTYNTSGVLQRQLRMTGFYGREILVDSSDILWVGGVKTSISGPIVMKLPASGNGVGTWGSYTYAAMSNTESAGSVTDAAYSGSCISESVPTVSVIPLTVVDRTDTYTPTQIVYP